MREESRYNIIFSPPVGDQSSIHHAVYATNYSIRHIQRLYLVSIKITNATRVKKVSLQCTYSEHIQVCSNRWKIGENFRLSHVILTIRTQLSVENIILKII